MSTSLQETIYQLKACTLKRLIFLFYELEEPIVKQYLDNCDSNASYTLHKTKGWVTLEPPNGFKYETTG